MTADLEATVIDAAFRAILNDDMATLVALQRRYPQFTLPVDAPRYVSSNREAMFGRTAIVHEFECGGGLLAFTVEADTDQIARFVGYRYAREECLMVMWWGTRLIGGKFIAQFTQNEEQ